MQPQGDATGSLLRKIALGGRAVGEGVASALSLPDSIGTGMRNLMSKGVNAVFGTHLQTDEPSWSDKLSQALTSAGAPVPQTPGEQMGSAITRGVSGALTGAGALGLASPALTTAPNIARAGVAGATGATASDYARQQGVGPLGQFAAGLVGGLTPAALEGSARIAGSLVGNVARPLTRSGQQQMAANILGRQSQDPQAAAANLSSAQPLVPGSLRTSGEASQDPGLLALEKVIRARNPGPFGDRISQQNTARQAELTALGGTPADIAAAKLARTQATDPMRDAALGNPVGGTLGTPTGIVHDTIDQILASPAGARESVSRTMQWARDLVGNETDPATLYEVRKDLQLAQMGKLQPSSPNAPNASTLAQTRSQLGQVVDSLDNAIDWAAPGFKAYLQRYRDMSMPIDQMKAIQEIQRRAATSQTDITTGQPFLGATPFSRALDQAIQRAGSRITPDQAQRLNAIRTDLKLGQAISGPLVKAPGSDTFQNLSIAQVFGVGLSDAHPALRVLTKPLGWVYQLAGSDARVNDILANAMLDPKTASQLLQRATPSSVASFSAKLRSTLQTVLPGASSRPLLALPSSLLSQPSQPAPAFPSPYDPRIAGNQPRTGLFGP